MKITMRDAVESFNALNALTNNYSFDLKVGYDLGKTLKSCRQEVDAYNEQLEILEQRYRIKDQSGNYILDPERLFEYKRDVREFGKTEVEIWGKAPIKLSVLTSAMVLAHKQSKPEDKEFVPTMPPAILSPLDWLIIADEVTEQTEAIAATA